MKNIVGITFALSATLVLSACSTPKPARDLATQGALVVDQAQNEAQGFIDRATNLFHAREELALGLAKSDINDSSKLEFSAWLSKEVGAPGDDEKRMQQVLRVLEKSRATRVANEAALAAKISSVSITYGEPVVLPTEKLDAAKKAFLNMAQELDAEQWLKFSYSYAKEVNDNLNALKPAADAASAPAPAANAAKPAPASL